MGYFYNQVDIPPFSQWVDFFSSDGAWSFHETFFSIFILCIIAWKSKEICRENTGASENINAPSENITNTIKI